MTQSAPRKDLTTIPSHDILETNTCSIFGGEHMAATVSHGLKDCTHLRTVPVISTFDGNGNVLPLYVKLEGETFKIYNAYVSESTFRILTFKGEVMAQDNTVKQITLNYFLNDLIWCIPNK